MGGSVSLKRLQCQMGNMTLYLFQQVDPVEDNNYEEDTIALNYDWSGDYADIHRSELSNYGDDDIYWSDYDEDIY